MAIILNNTSFILNNSSFVSINGYATNVILTNKVLSLDATNISSYPGSGTTWYDISGYGNNATLVNGPTFSNNNSIRFNGTNNYATIETSASLNLAASSFTVSQFIKVNDFTNTEAASLMWEDIRGGNDFEPISIRYSWFTTPRTSVTLAIFNTAGSSVEITSTVNLLTNTVYNIVGTYDGATAKLYINGILNTSQASSILVGTPASNARWILGAGELDSTRWFNGNIYNTEIYNTALSATEISSSYVTQKEKYPSIVTSGSVFVVDASAISSYPGSGTSWYDISGNSNTGSLVNGPIYNGSSSFAFDGTADYARFNSGSAINNLASSSFSMWLNWTDPVTTTDTSFLYKSDDGLSQGWYMGIDSTRGGIGFAVACATSNKRYYLPASETPARNTWYMLTITWNGNVTTTGGVSVYINGVKNTTAPQTDNAGSGTHTSDAAQVLDFGNNRTKSLFWFGGYVGFIQIHNRVLTDAEILQNYNATKTIYGL